MQSQMLRYCAGCMTKVSEAGRCPNPGCRWDEAQQVETQEHLPRHYVLLDRYYIGRVLGQGGFGVTYVAQDLKLDRVVAIKEFLPKDQCSRRTDRVTVHSYSAEKGEQFRFGLERFLSEAQNVAKLGGHPNIVSITDYAEANGTAYMVMEFIPGVTLKQYLADQGGKIPYTVATEIMMHVMSGLNKAHEHGLIHRDVSPDNIMISSLGPVKLIDFGAARQAVGERSQNLTMVLKPGYAPEEQYRSRGVQGAWTDVYATAATLYRCITGHVPPAAPDRLAEDDLIRPSLIVRDLPAAMDAAIVKALTVRAAERPQTMKEFRQMLMGQPVAPPPSPPVQPPLVVQAGENAGQQHVPFSSYVTAPTTPRLFTPRAVWLATFLGTPLGGCIVMAVNYSRLNKPSSAWKAVISGIVITAALATGEVLSPTGDVWSALFLGTEIGLAIALSSIAENYQGDEIKESQQQGAARLSYWTAFGIGMLTLVLQLAVEIPLMIAQQQARARETALSNSASDLFSTTPATTSTGGSAPLSLPNSDSGAGTNSGAAPDTSSTTGHSISVGKGVVDYWDPVTAEEAQKVGNFLHDGDSSYLSNAGARIAIEHTAQGTLFVMTIVNKSFAQEIASGQDDTDMLWIGRGLAGEVGGVPADLRLVNEAGDTIRDIPVTAFIGLFGVVEDASGASVAGAAVTATNESDNSSFNATTTDAGIYEFPNLAAGSYTVEVQAKGFSAYQRSGVQVTAGEVNNANVTLAVGSSQ